MTRYWVGVASRDHVRAAVDGGFCQLNHGKEVPLKRIARGDRILYYSPREAMKAASRSRPLRVSAKEAAEGFLAGQPKHSC